MSNTDAISLALRRALFGSALGAAVSLPVMAQTAAPTAPTVAIEEVLVTGLRIAQPNLQTVSPVATVSAEEVRLSGTIRVQDLLNNLPQVVAAQGGDLANGSTGTAQVDLHNLGPQRTLVLVNGRRLMPGDPSQNAFEAPDLNQIPAALIKRIDVLTGGASAVYGADAVASVVNFSWMITFRVSVSTPTSVPINTITTRMDWSHFIAVPDSSKHPAASAPERATISR